MDTSTKVVLLLEDEPPINEMLSQFLTEEGYKVLSALSASEALALLQAVTCNLILLDFNLPGLDGNGFLSVLPQEAKDIPVVGMSATPHLFKKDKQLKTVVPKPFDLFTIAEVVAKFSN